MDHDQTDHDYARETKQWYELQDWANRRIARLGLGDHIALFHERHLGAGAPYACLVDAAGEIFGAEPGVPAVAIPALVLRLERELIAVLNSLAAPT